MAKRAAPGLFALMDAARRFRAGGPGPKVTLMVLIEHMGLIDGEWLCWPSAESLAYATEQSTGTVRRHLAAYEAAGLVERRIRGKLGGGRGDTVFVLNAGQLLGVQSTDMRVGGSSPTRIRGGVQRASEGGSNAHPTDPLLLLEVPEEVPGTPTVAPLVSGPLFDDFWPVYPRHEGKGAARTAWAKAITKADPTAVIAGAQRYRDDPNRSPEFTAHASTWLNAERWADDPLPPRAAQRAGARVPQRIDTDRARPSGVVEL